MNMSASNKAMKYYDRRFSPGCPLSQAMTKTGGHEVCGVVCVVSCFFFSFSNIPFDFKSFAQGKDVSSQVEE